MKAAVFAIWTADTERYRLQGLKVAGARNGHSRLKDLALDCLATRARTLTVDMLRSLGRRLTKQVWLRILQQETDSLTVWITFATAFPDMLEEYPVYTCEIAFGNLGNIEVPGAFPLVVMLPHLTRSAIHAIVKLPNLAMLDLSSCTLSVDGLRALDQALQYGRLQDLHALSLPLVGRPSEKPLLAKIHLPEALSYLESPVPRDGWKRCRTKQIKPAVVLNFGANATKRAKAYGR